MENARIYYGTKLWKLNRELYAKDQLMPVVRRQCGWLKDKFGFNWQITPKRLNELLSDSDPMKSQRVMMAMMQMRKIVIADLEKAYSGE